MKFDTCIKFLLKMATDDDHTQKKSPLIEELQWGFTKAKGFPSGKDLRLFPGGKILFIFLIDYLIMSFDN